MDYYTGVPDLKQGEEESIKTEAFGMEEGIDEINSGAAIDQLHHEIKLEDSNIKIDRNLEYSMEVNKNNEKHIWRQKYEFRQIEDQSCVDNMIAQLFGAHAKVILEDCSVKIERGLVSPNEQSEDIFKNAAGVARVRPYAVAVNGFKQFPSKVVSKIRTTVELNSSHSYNSSLKLISKKNRKSKFPRICLSGKTASDLLARSPQCTVSSSLENDDCGNNSTQYYSSLENSPYTNSKEPNRIKTTKSKSLLASLSKFKKPPNQRHDTPAAHEEEEADFACHYCVRTFTTKSGLRWHESYSHRRTCSICAKYVQFSNRRGRHKEPVCNSCDEKFPRPKSSPTKQKVAVSLNHYNPQKLTEKQKLYYRFKCDICSKLFGKRNRMIKHITNNHPADKLKIDLAKFVASPKKNKRPRATRSGRVAKVPSRFED